MAPSAGKRRGEDRAPTDLWLCLNFCSALALFVFLPIKPGVLLSLQLFPRMPRLCMIALSSNREGSSTVTALRRFPLGVVFAC